MAGNPVPPSRDLHGGTAEIRPPPPERRLEWCGSGYGVEKWRSAPGEEGRLDPGVSLLAGATGAKYKSMSPAKLPITRVPCLTIPPGFSPSALLESPVLLTNMKAEPSPTTGKVNMAYIEDKTVCSDTLSSPSDSSNINTYSKSYSRDFEFRPHVGESYRAGLSSLRPLVFPIQGSVSLLQGEQESSLLIQCQSQGQNKVASENESTLLVSAPILATEVSNSRDCLQPETASDVLPQRKPQRKGSDDDTQTFQSDFSQPTPSSILEKSAEDGFNWRKYGQKHVKGSEFPRSYYKCTHPNCEMRKLMERSHDGKVTGITYKGHHDHPKPQSTRASAVGAIFTSQDEEKTDSFLPLVSVEDESEIVPSHISHHADRNNNTELSPTLISDKDVEIGGGQSSNCDDVGEDGDPESKRRKMELIMNDTSSIGKMNREPRVVVQTISEVDILDDGYRWRKYGQKVVKGNPNPRSYYKCTTAGCPVRKHVERASHDPKAVITTYEGKHNHDVPASKTTGHEASASMAADGDSSQATHSSPALSSTMRSIPHSFTQMESDTISLDLGVGISPNQNNVTYWKPHSGEKEQIQHNQPQSIDCGQLVIQAVPLSGFHETSRTRAHGIGEIKSAGFEFRVSPRDDPANMYFTTSENLVMGP